MTMPDTKMIQDWRSDKQPLVFVSYRWCRLCAGNSESNAKIFLAEVGALSRGSGRVVHLGASSISASRPLMLSFCSLSDRCPKSG